MAFVGKNVTNPEKKSGFTYKGREILLTKTMGRPVGGIEKRAGWYSEDKRLEVVTTYAVSGNKTLVESLTGVPQSTIGRWIREEWFQTLLDAVRAENDHLIDVKQTAIVQKALDQIEDRVDNGDFHVLKDGQVIRKPMSGKDLSLVEAINLDKRQLLRGKPTSRTEQVNNKTVEDKLEELATNFRKIASRQPMKELEVQDVEIIEEKNYAQTNG